MTTLRRMVAEGRPVLAPLVLNPMMARMAERAGFRALYLGGASGCANVFTEANLTFTGMCQAGLDIGAACTLPLILDGARGWGDPYAPAPHRRVGQARRFPGHRDRGPDPPKRAHHHVSIEHIIPGEEMAAKVREAVTVRRGRDFLIIARTNAVRMHGIDDALRRAEQMAEAGADMLFVLTAAWRSSAPSPNASGSR